MQNVRIKLRDSLKESQMKEKIEDEAAEEK
jgi:hypothetical protein